MNYDAHPDGLQSTLVLAPTPTECDLKVEPTVPWADLTSYENSILSSPAWTAFQGSTSSLVGEALSLRIIDAALDLLPDVGQVLISSSTGKDSTVAAALVAKILVKRKNEGRHVPKTIVGIADTAAEFPTMAVRMRTEAAAINAWGKQTGIPIRAIIAEPPVHHRLLVELLGNGKPLPKQASGKSKHGQEAQGWCMDRVKGGPLGQIQALAQGRPTLNILGVRRAESGRRNASVERHSGGLPFGLTKVFGGSLGCTPIVFWENAWIGEWGARDAVLWNTKSFRELHQIYGKASNDFESPGECAIVVTQEGHVSNSCSDLSGQRFGCWMCLLSRNKSLKNMALHDEHYRWLRGFHAYLYNHHKKNERRRKLIRKFGFDENSLFPKNFLMEERYFLSMLLMRAERESGFSLLKPEEWEMIETFWRKSGVFTVTRDDVRLDMEDWIKTGHPVPFWKRHDGRDLVNLANTLNEGIPAGAYFHHLHPKLNPVIAMEDEHLHEALRFARNCNDDDLKGTIVCKSDPLRVKVEDLLRASGIDDILVVTKTRRKIVGQVLVLDVNNKRSTQALEAVHLTAMIGQGCGLWPTLQAHVMTDLRDADKFLVLVTDTPSTIGLRTNTGLLSGLHGAGWHCHGGREPTRWELEMANGRNFFYRGSFREMSAGIQALQKSNETQVPELLASYWENTRVIAMHGGPEDILAHAFVQMGHAIDDWKNLAHEQHQELLQIAADLIHYLDILEGPGRRAIRIAREGARSPLLVEESPAGAAFRRDLRAQVALEVDPNVETFKKLVATWQQASRFCRKYDVGPAVLERCTYDIQMEAVDPEVTTLWNRAV